MIRLAAILVFIAAVAALALTGCATDPPPPRTIVVPHKIKPRIAPECRTKGDPKQPEWVRRNRDVDTYLDDEMRRDAVNEGRQTAWGRRIVARRQVCDAGLAELER